MVTKNRLKRDFSQIPNDLICDSTLSNTAHRVAMYLFSRPDNWDINNANIMSETGIKAPETIAASFASLIDRGWISRERKRNKDGKIIGGFDYQLNEYRITPNEESDLNRKKPLLGKNPALNNTESSSNTELSTTTRDAREDSENLEETPDRSPAPQAPQATESEAAETQEEEGSHLKTENRNAEQLIIPEVGEAATMLEQDLANSLLGKPEGQALPFDSSSAYSYLTGLLDSTRDRQRVLSAARRSNVSEAQLDAFTREFCGRFENYPGGRNVRSGITLESRFIKWLSTHDFTWKGLSYMDKSEFVEAVEQMVGTASETAKNTWRSIKEQGHIDSLVKVYSDMSAELQSLPGMHGVTPSQWAALFLEMPTKDLRKKTAEAVSSVANKSYYRNQLVSVHAAIRAAINYNNSKP